MTETHDLLATIGNTPLIELRRSSPKSHVKIWAKLELANPSGSLKDRIALHMIEAAEARGELEPGMTIVEATSGNTGIALGLVAAVKGYRLKLFMLENKTIERRKMLRYWGADLVLTTQDDPDSHIFGAQELIAEEPDSYFYINQNENRDNILAHSLGTGAEILSQLDGDVAALRQELEAIWPASTGRRARLYALGFDAYRLVPLLRNDREALQQGVPGMTGKLTLTADRRIQRELDWARISGGRLIRLASTHNAE